MTDTAQKTLGNYRILGKIGQGGMGAVFKAVQVSMQREVALKILPPRLAKDQAYVQRFLREAQSAGQISHPNLIQVYDVGFADGYHFFAMEFVDGPTLKKMMKEHGPLNEAVAVDYMKQVATALGVAHARGIVHRDVKPDNVIINGSGLAKLADLGLAKPMDGAKDVTLSGQTIGTPAYMSPEQNMGDDVDGRSDLYSLGVTFHHLLTGTMLFEAPTSAGIAIKHVNEPPKPIRQIRPELTPGIEAILLKLLQKKPEQRYQRAEALIADLDALQSGVFRVTAGKAHSAPRLPHPPHPPRHGREPTPRQPVMLYAGVGVLLAAGIGIAVAMVSGDGDTTPKQASQPPPTTVDPAPPSEDLATVRAREMLAFARKHLAEHPDDLLGTRQFALKAQQAGRSTVIELEATTFIADLDRRHQTQLDAAAQAAEAALASLRRSVTAAIAAGNYDDALAQLDTAPASPATRDGIAQLRSQATTAGKQALAAVLDRARAALTEGKPDLVTQELATAASIPFALGLEGTASERSRLAQDAAALKDAQARQAAEELHRRIGGLAGEVARLAAECRSAAVTKLLDEAGRDPAYKPVAAAVKSLQGVAGVQLQREAAVFAYFRQQIGKPVNFTLAKSQAQGPLRKVDVKGLEIEVRSASGAIMPMTLSLDRIAGADLSAADATWQPQDPAGHLLVALLACHRVEAEPLESAIAALGQTHPLHSWLAAQLTLVKAGREDRLAQQEWTAFTAKLPSGTIRASIAKPLLAELDALALRHQNTRFWQEQADAIAAVRRRLSPEALLAHWRLDEGRGSSAADAAGRGGAIELGDGEHWSTTGRLGGCLRFDGTSHATAPAANGLDGLKELTVSLWFLCQRGGTLIGKRAHFSVADNMSWHLAIGQRPQTAGLQLHADIAHLNFRQRAETIISPDQWHHAALVFRAVGAAGQLRLYLDGKEILKADIPATEVPATNTPLCLGGYPDCPELFIGMLDEVRILGRALDAAEIANLASMKE